MSRLRRIAIQERIFFITTNLAKGVAPLSPAERDFVLNGLGALRSSHRFLILGYVIMPDHAHLLLASTPESISHIMHQWKFKTGFAVLKARGNRAALWQPRYFDFICRRNRDVSNKLRYIHKNPVAAGLARSSTDWHWSSAAFYVKSGTAPVIPDQMDFVGDPDELLWPAPWRRL